MPQLVADCPRCDSRRIAFDVLSCILVKRKDWQHYWEAFCVCGHCDNSTVFVLEQKDYVSGLSENPCKFLLNQRGSINDIVRVLAHISGKDSASHPAPEFLPDNIRAAFDEGAKCLAVGCFNAAGTMFRLCVDMTTRDKLPAADAAGLNAKTRRDLGLRLPWLFEAKLLPEDLRELSHCIKEDGNDGAHQGTLHEHDALDLLDFTVELLERVYTQPEKLRLAAERRAQRRA